MKHVVVWDPRNEYWEGALVDGENVSSLNERKVATLPASPELFAQGGFCGYAKRSWGAGWPLDSAIPIPVTPLSIFYPGEPFRLLSWRARLVGKAGQGIPLRLMPGEARGNVIRPMVQDFQGRRNQVDVAALGKPDEFGGWTVGGEANLCVQGPNMVALALYGCAPGMRVAWLAASLTPYGAAASLSPTALIAGKY